MASSGSSIILIAVIAVIYTPISSQMKIISSPQITNLGVWGPWEHCPEGSFAYQFRFRYEPYSWFNDDTGLNAIRLKCHDPKTKYKTGVISSTEGSYGFWSKVFYPTFPEEEGCLYLVGFVLKSEPYQGDGDDIGATQIHFKCGKGGWAHSPAAIGEWGVFTAPQFCDEGQAICGIQTQVQPPQGGGDDTALNNVKFLCCDCPLCPRD